MTNLNMYTKEQLIKLIKNLAVNKNFDLKFLNIEYKDKEELKNIFKCIELDDNIIKKMAKFLIQECCSDYLNKTVTELTENEKYLHDYNRLWIYDHFKFLFNQWFTTY